MHALHSNLTKLSLFKIFVLFFYFRFIIHKPSAKGIFSKQNSTRPNNAI